ncbi:MAG: STAS domain-containing protein [Pseudomonadales bacterium]
MGQILAGQHKGVYLLRFEGDVRLTLCAAADRYLARMFEDPQFKGVMVDLTSALGIDSTSLGLLAKLSIRAKEQFGFIPTLICDSADLRRLLDSMGFDDVFNIVDSAPQSPADLGPLPALEVPDAQLRAQVLDAHRVLMSMNDNNRDTFKDLVEALEADEAQAQSEAAARLSPSLRASL